MESGVGAFDLFRLCQMLFALLLLLLLVAAFFYPPPLHPSDAPVNKLFFALTALFAGSFPTGAHVVADTRPLPGALPSPPFLGLSGDPMPNIFAMGARPLNHSASPLRTHRHCKRTRSKR